MRETPEMFAGHSLRRGGATIWLILWSHAMGVPIWSICYGAMLSMGVHTFMVLGDWTSLAVRECNDVRLDFLQCLPRMLAIAAM